MSLATEVAKSTSQLRYFAEIDIADPNIQWVNAGAGIWYASATNIYTVMSAKLPGNNLGGAFTAQNFGAIGSTRVDGLPQTKVATLLDLTTTATSFYYDGSDLLYIRLINYDEPVLHRITMGVIYGYTAAGFSPTGGPGVYEGRLKRNPMVSARRDPLFFGRITFKSGSISLDNSDGEFDKFGVDNDIYGNEARIKLGFDGIDYDDYKTVFTGYVENFAVSETEATFQISDKRKQLTKPVTIVSTNVNALDEIADILFDAYGYTYSSTFFDLTAWAAAREAIPAARSNITLNMQEPAPVIDVIEDIAASVFGLFRVDADGKFTFRIVDSGETIEALIPAADVLTAHAVRYDPSEVVSSVRVGYNRNWATTGTQYTYYTDDDRAATTFSIYKTYNERTFDTLLIDETAATGFAGVVLDYTDTVRGTETITVPLEHYVRNLGDIIGVEIQRGDEDMLGDYKAEVIAVEVGFDSPIVRLGIRHGEVIEAIMQTEGGATMITEGGALMMVE